MRLHSLTHEKKTFFYQYNFFLSLQDFQAFEIHQCCLVELIQQQQEEQQMPVGPTRKNIMTDPDQNFMNNL